MNNLFNGSVGTFCGTRIIENDEMMSEWSEDWSGCRSIPRAKRRHARGIKTRMTRIKVPVKYAYFMDNGRTMVVHSQVRRLLEAEALKDPEQIESEAFLRKEKPEPKPDSPWRSELRWTFPQLMGSIIDLDPAS